MTELLNKPVVDDALLRTITDRIVAVADVDRIILFGSASTGTMTDDSDIDLLVIESSPINVIDEALTIRRSLRGIYHSFDIFVVSTAEFERTKDLVGTLAQPAHKYGKVLYDKRP